MARGSSTDGIAAGVGWKALLALAGVLGAATGIAVAQGGAARGTTPCQANPNATTITQATYSGSNGPDTIQANDKDNVIYGRGRPDTICSYQGKDRVYGGRGGDDLWGEAQNDQLKGGSQADVLRGGNGGSDLCKGGAPRPDGGGEDPDGAVDCETIQGASPL